MSGHTIQDKLRILDLVEACGLTHQIVAAFGEVERVDERFLAYMHSQGRDMAHFYVFSELGDEASPPRGFVLAQRYGWPHIIIEIDFQRLLESFGEIGVLQRLWWATRWLSHHKPAKTNYYINIRDWPKAWAESAVGVLELMSYLGRLPLGIRPGGILYEDPSGRMLPCEVVDLLNHRSSMLDIKA